MKTYENVTDVVIVLEGTPTGKVFYRGQYRSIPKTRVDTFISLYHNLLKQGRRPLGIITGDKEKDPIDFYIKSELERRGISEDSINLEKLDNVRITLDEAVKVKKFVLKEGLQKLPSYLVTSEEHMRHTARKDFEKCLGNDIRMEYVSAPWGVTGLERIKAELHGVIARPLDALALMNVENGDYKELRRKTEMFWPLREFIRKIYRAENIGRKGFVE